MISNITVKLSGLAHIQLFEGVNHLAKKSTLIAIPLGIGVTVLDLGLNAIKYPLDAIEKLACAIFNILGALFFTCFSVKDGIDALGRSLGQSIASFVAIPLNLIVVPFRLFLVLKDLSHAKSIEGKALEFSVLPFFSFPDQQHVTKVLEIAGKST